MFIIPDGRDSSHLLPAIAESIPYPCNKSRKFAWHSSPDLLPRADPECCFEVSRRVEHSGPFKYGSIDLAQIWKILPDDCYISWIGTPWVALQIDCDQFRTLLKLFELVKGFEHVSAGPNLLQVAQMAYILNR